MSLRFGKGGILAHTPAAAADADVGSEHQSQGNVSTLWDQGSQISAVYRITTDHVLHVLVVLCLVDLVADAAVAIVPWGAVDLTSLFCTLASR